MRNLILFGPLLWLRSVLLWVLILLFVVLLLLYIIGNSPLAVKQVLERFAPDYNISYRSIRGNVFTGFTIDNPQYKHEKIAKEMTLKWNLNTLAEKKISIQKVHLKEANVEVIKALVASFGSESNSSDESNSSSFGYEVDVKDVDISLLPFEIAGIGIKKARIISKTLSYKDEKINADTLDLMIDSNISKIAFKGDIKSNYLLGHMELTPYEGLYTQYAIPLRKKAIKKIIADINASQECIVADISTSATALLEAKKDAFNLDVPMFKSHLVYTINSQTLAARTHAIIVTPYTKKMNIYNELTFDEKIRHNGHVEIASVEGIDAKLAKLLENLRIRYSGDSKGIETAFKSDRLKGYFDTKDFVEAKAHIESVDAIALATLVALPPELQDAKGTIRIDAPLNLKDFSKIQADVKVSSNVVNLDATLYYADEIRIDGDITIPQASLLKQYSPELKWQNLSPMATKVIVEKNALHIDISSKAVQSRLVYGVDKGSLEGKISLEGEPIIVSGRVNEKLSIKTSITSVESLGKRLNRLYPVGELPPLSGKIDVSLDVLGGKDINLNITAPKIIYQPNKRTKQVLNDVKLKASMQGDMVELKSYQVTYDKQKYFATKPSKVQLGETIIIKELWINDTLKIEGEYTPKSKQGNFHAKADSFHIKDKIADLYAQIDIDATLDNEDTRVDGNIVLLKGKVTPQVEGRTFASDSDIIFTHLMKAKKQNSFMDNLSLMLQIKTKKPLLLKQPNTYIKLKPEMTISKEKGAKLLYLGSVDLPKGGSYVFQDKKFVLDKSAVYFTGDVNKPVLDIKAKYQSLNHLITIAVTGTPLEPNINFSSSPSLSREQILSVLLFDTEGGGDTHSGSEMMRMMGGAMAKAALADVGVKVDHLAFGEGNSIEVGKKLNSKTMLIYINGEIPKVKLKYQHNKRTESVFGVSEESQSYDIIYKRDF